MRERVYETHKKENKYDLSGKYGIGYTYKGDEFYFDLDDYTLIKEYCWCIDHEGYVSTNLWDDDKKKSIRMHRLIINVSGKKDEIDHINNNKKDNSEVNDAYKILGALKGRVISVNKKIHEKSKWYE